MKTNKIQVITSAVALGLVAILGNTKVTGGHLTGFALTVAYFAVAAAVAIAIADYRSSSRGYRA